MWKTFPQWLIDGKDQMKGVITPKVNGFFIVFASVLAPTTSSGS